MNEWVFIVQHSKSLHYQIVCDEHQQSVPRWQRLLKRLRPFRNVILLILPYLI